MRLRKVISGGQTGADKTGLECARDLGLETGGTAPLGYRTEKGRDPSLIGFGVAQSHLASYPPRTKENVRNAEVTLWFGNVGSAGYWCTRNAARVLDKRFVENPTPDQVKELAEQYEVWNIAGNRASANPKVIGLVTAAFEVVKSLKGD